MNDHLRFTPYNGLDPVDVRLDIAVVNHLNIMANTCLWTENSTHDMFIKSNVLIPFITSFVMLDRKSGTTGQIPVRFLCNLCKKQQALDMQITELHFSVWPLWVPSYSVHVKCYSHRSGGMKIYQKEVTQQQHRTLAISNVILYLNHMEYKQEHAEKTHWSLSDTSWIAFKYTRNKDGACFQFL